MKENIKITHTKDFYEMSKEYFDNPYDELQELPFSKTYLDNPGGSRMFFVAHNDEDILGVLSHSNQKTKHKTLLTVVSVSETYLGNNISGLLVEELMKWSENHNKIIVNTDYTEDGNAYLKEKIKNLQKKHPNTLWLEDDFMKTTMLNNDLFNSNKTFKEVKETLKEYKNKIEEINIQPDYSLLDYEESIKAARMIETHIKEVNTTIIEPFLGKNKKRLRKTKP